MDLLDLDVGARLARQPICHAGARSGWPATGLSADLLPGHAAHYRRDGRRRRSGGDLRGIDLRLEPLPVARILGRSRGAGSAIAGRTLRLFAEGTEELGDGGETATAITTVMGPSRSRTCRPAFIRLKRDGRPRSSNYGAAARRSRGRRSHERLRASTAAMSFRARRISRSRPISRVTRTRGSAARV